MEEKKNNATEKVDNITKEVSFAEQLKNDVENQEKPIYNTVIDDNLDKKVKDRKQKVKKHNAKKEAERMEKAKLRAEKNEAKKAKKQAKKQSDIERKAQLKALKLQKKEERLKRRDMLKNESKIDKMERLSAEKQAKREARLAKLEKKAELKREKLLAKKQAREQKRLHRLENKRQRRSRGIGGWLAAVISLGSVALVLGTLLTFSLIGNMGGNNMFESVVERNFYELVSGIENMDVNLSKVMVSNDKEEQQKLLFQISNEATMASNDLAELPLQDETKFNTQKFINQVGDFSKYIAFKLIDGEKLTKTDYENLESIYTINRGLKDKLSQTASEIKENFNFISLLNSDSENLISSSFAGLEQASITYPKMIYDGPFSDGNDTQNPRGLSGQEITLKEAEDIFSSIFDEYNFESVNYMSEVGGRIPCYAFEGSVSDDVVVYGEISKVGGKLIMFECFKDCMEENVSLDESMEICEKFLTKLGFKNMEEVWATQSNGEVFANFVKKENGVIIYSDMVKIKVCQSRGVVSAFDATEYYLNHTSRKISKPSLSKAKAVEKMTTKLNVENVRLCLIPKQGSKEVLAYEIAGKFNGDVYYVYVDANTGKETEIFKVVETNQGTLLM